MDEYIILFREWKEEVLLVNVGKWEANKRRWFFFFGGCGVFSGRPQFYKMWSVVSQTTDYIDKKKNNGQTEGIDYKSMLKPPLSL